MTAPIDAAALLARLERYGIERIEQALLCLPSGFTDFTTTSPLGDALPTNEGATTPRLFSVVASERATIHDGAKTRIVLAATDGLQSVRIVIFVVGGVDVSYWKSLNIGERLFLFGSLQMWEGRLQITGPTPIPHRLVGAVRPEYTGRRGVVSAKVVRAAVELALHDIPATVRYVVGRLRLSEAQIIKRARLTTPSLAALLRAVHCPRNIRQAEAAMSEVRRLGAFGVVWAAQTMRQRSPCPAAVVAVSVADIQALVARLPKKLTIDQRRAIRDICADLNAPHPMRRVLSGDVGCGKTFAYMLPALAAQMRGALVAVLTPNSLLVGQFVQECREIFGDECPVVGVTGASRKTLDLGGNPILVGTTALLDRLRKQNLTPAFLVVDEQQKFSVEQKAALAVPESNLLEATATPIPRTTALVTHGSMDVSVIRSCPVAKNITSHVVERKDAARLFTHTRKVLGASGQVAVVYPIVENAKQARKSVVAAFERWNAEFPDQVGLVYGGMRDAEKHETIRRLKAGELAVCVCTIVIELGLTMPSLKSVVVVHAERYGVSQLHQLRGRVARLGGNGYFFMFLPKTVGAKTMARLRLVEGTNDGFLLAEQDAKMRGYGDLTADAERQHGTSRSMLFFGMELCPDDIAQFAEMPTLDPSRRKVA